MGFASAYLEKHSFFDQQIAEPPSGLLHFIVVIPAYLEENIHETLNSLLQATPPKSHCEVILVVNHSETDSFENKEKNQSIFLNLKTWCNAHSKNNIKFYPIFAPDLPIKHAGAGLARKIGMDEAVRRFNYLDYSEGIILSLDADSRVDLNYFTEIDAMMGYHPSAGGCLIYFEHLLSGEEFTQDIYNAATKYELHLRYYRHALKAAMYPFSYYTIGSCFGVKNSVYVSQGGMNRRQAGEDFYFLHKLFPNREFVEITGTCVYPSSRPSFRVPFGTGPVIQRLITGEDHDFFTYHPDAFNALHQLFQVVPILYSKNSNTDKLLLSLPESVHDFLGKMKFQNKLCEIRENTSSKEAFIKRFFQWFDGFMVVRFLNYTHNKFYTKLVVKEAVQTFFKKGEMESEFSESELLEMFRRADREEKLVTTIFSR